jgi:hypothetical protein
MKSRSTGGAGRCAQSYLAGEEPDAYPPCPSRPRAGAASEPSPGGLTPHEIVAEGLGALTSDERKRLKAHLERMRIAPDDKRVKQGWLDAIVDNFSGDYEDAPLYEQLPALLAALDEQHALANRSASRTRRRSSDATRSTRGSDREAEGLFDRHAPSAQGALTPRMYDADTAPS